MKTIDKFNILLGAIIALTILGGNVANTLAAPKKEAKKELKESKSKQNLASDWDAWCEVYAKARYGSEEGKCDLPY